MRLTFNKCASLCSDVPEFDFYLSPDEIVGFIKELRKALIELTEQELL